MGHPGLWSTLNNHLLEVSAWTNLAGSMFHLPALEPFGWRREVEWGKRTHFLEERNSLLFQIWAALLLRCLSEKDICGVWPVIWGADQGPAYTVQTVLGLNFSRRHKKLNGHLDKLVKDCFILPSNRGKKLFQTVPVHSPQPHGPLRSLLSGTDAKSIWNGCQDLISIM